MNRISGNPNFARFSATSTLNDKRAFESAAQRVALRKRDGDHRQMESHHHVIGDIDTVVRIAAQRIDVARADALDEEIEIAAEIVHSWDARTADKIFHRRGFARAQAGEQALQQPPHRDQLVQQCRREARRPVRPHVAPDGFFVGTDRQIEFVEFCVGQFGAEVDAGARDCILPACGHKIIVGPKLQLRRSFRIRRLSQAPQRGNVLWYSRAQTISRLH